MKRSLRRIWYKINPIARRRAQKRFNGLLMKAFAEFFGEEVVPYVKKQAEIWNKFTKSANFSDPKKCERIVLKKGSNGFPDLVALKEKK